jgi:uncharacterized repeat protein (TIGR03803 family)
MKTNQWTARVGVGILLCAAAVASGQTVATLVQFDGTNGSVPAVPPVQGANGDFYGVTTEGGTDQGIVYKMTPKGKLTTLYNFTGGNDGADPKASLVLGTDGYLYGTTYSGGPNNAGTIFKISQKGTLAYLHSFTGAGGANPQTALVQGPGDVFYGLTSVGGANNDGALFQITSNGTFTLLHSFAVQTDGYYPLALTLSNGGLYGTTLAGGAHGSGTVFEATTSGTVTTMYSFSGFADGAYPMGLVAVSGDLYGTTTTGYGSSQWGTIFQITAAGNFNTLYSFTNGDDGDSPEQLILGTDGNLYGVAELGGDQGTTEGSIFMMTPAGALTELYGFNASGPAGNEPAGGLFQGTDGSFYGTTLYGAGACSCGAVYSISNGLSPFVYALPAAGKAGDTIKIMGADLTGASEVTFNGVRADFSVVSATEIKATVPSRATSGPVRVTTPAGSLVSAAEFQVRK